MALACQRDSYKKQLITRVKSCTQTEVANLSKGSFNSSNYDIILEDTILFPEGGGQPSDRGTIGDIEVVNVSRRGANAIHLVAQPIEPGSEVEVKVDWARRWDHMQQHSAQHLITALTDASYGYKTTSWYLGDKVSFIELDTDNMRPEEVCAVERSCNEKIREGVRVFPTLYDDANCDGLKKVRARGLPDDHSGPVRIMTIEGIEDNMCCGTHVSNLSHLQVIKLLGIEKGKKGKVKLNFIAGNRVLQYMEKCIENETALTSLLKGGPDQHVELVDKIQKSLKIASKNASMLLHDVAVLEVAMFKARSPKECLFILYRKEGDNEFMNTIVNEISDKEVLIFLTTGDEKSVGTFLLTGPEPIVAELGPKIIDILDGKGACKGGRFQGKVNKMSRRGEAEKLLRERRK